MLDIREPRSATISDIYGVAQQPALIRKLRRHRSLSASEVTALGTALGQSVRRLGDRSVIAERGIAPQEISVMLSGWACRFVADGPERRRIVAFYVPGDICDFDAFLTPAMDQSIATIGEARVAGFNRATLNGLAQAQPGVSQALLWESLASTAIQRAWTVNVGRRDAASKLAHLLCELMMRLSLVDLVDDGVASLPLRQADLADACGLTTVHVNRTLRQFRNDGLADIRNGKLFVPDTARLAEIGRFDPSYFPLRRFQRENPDTAPAMPGIQIPV